MPICLLCGLEGVTNLWRESSMNNLFKVTVLSVFAFFCMSGQMTRKDVRDVPSTQIVINEVELQNEKPKAKEKKSAARRSMEGQTTMARKSSAKRAMALELEE